MLLEVTQLVWKQFFTPQTLLRLCSAHTKQVFQAPASVYFSSLSICAVFKEPLEKETMKKSYTRAENDFIETFWWKPNWTDAKITEQYSELIVNFFEFLSSSSNYFYV